jgi:ribosomal protein S18 acetylase RimI-like enzyme
MTDARPEVACVRTMAPGDVDEVVALQVAFLDGSIVTELGTSFLKRFHHAALAHQSIRAFVAVGAGGAIVGFVQASCDVHAFNSYMRPRILARLASALLVPARWRLIGHFVQGIGDREPQPPMPAELLLLVVDASVRRQQVGRRLVGALEDTFASEKISRYRVAVRSQLTIARAFYLATGFEREQELSVLGAPMTYLTKPVGTTASTSDRRS